MAVIAGIVALSLVLPADGQSAWALTREREMARLQAEAIAQLTRAERLWKDARIDGYEFKVRFTCGLCPPELPPGRPPFVVRDGKISLKGGAPVPAPFQNYSSVDNIFKFIRAEIAKRPSRVKIEYDEKAGYPRSVFIDPAGNMTDDEDVFVVENFIVAPQREQASVNEEIMQLLREIPAPRQPALTVEQARPQNLLSTRLRALGQDGVVLLANALESNQVSVRRNAVIELHFLASGIGNSGRVAKVVISAAQPALVRSMKDSDACVRGWSLDALRAAGLPREIMPQVIEMLGDADVGVRLSACAAAASYGVAAKASLPDIERLLADSSPDVRTCAKSAIEKIRAN